MGEIMWQKSMEDKNNQLKWVKVSFTINGNMSGYVSLCVYLLFEMLWASFWSLVCVVSRAALLSLLWLGEPLFKIAPYWLVFVVWAKPSPGLTSLNCFLFITAMQMEAMRGSANNAQHTNLRHTKHYFSHGIFTLYYIHITTLLHCGMYSALH